MFRVKKRKTKRIQRNKKSYLSKPYSIMSPERFIASTYSGVEAIKLSGRVIKWDRIIHDIFI